MPRATKTDTKGGKGVRPPGPTVLHVKLSADEYQSLLQIHSVVCTKSRNLSVAGVVRYCIRSAAQTLSLPVPGSSVWPVRRKGG
jgi:hypothetical protein